MTVAILIIHVIAGGVGLLSGAAALVFRKGGRVHRTAGKIFIAAMLVMAVMALNLGVSGPFGIGASLAGALVFYFVMTAWLTVRRKQPRVGAPEYVGMALGLAVAAAYAVVSLQAPAGNVGAIAGPLVGVGFAGVGAGLDLRVILRGGISGTARVARHVWRVSLPFFMANSFFFLAQPDIFLGVPLPVLAAPPLSVVALMTFWLVRIRLTKQFKAAAA